MVKTLLRWVGERGRAVPLDGCCCGGARVLCVVQGLARAHMPACACPLPPRQGKGEEVREPSQLDVLLGRLPGCVTKELADELAVNFCYCQVGEQWVG